MSHATCISLAFACVQFQCTGQRSQILFRNGNLTLANFEGLFMLPHNDENFLHVEHQGGPGWHSENASRGYTSSFQCAEVGC